MIQKIIHLCWLSGDAFPADIVKCLETWKKYLKDYEIWLWGKKPQDCLGLNVIEKHFDLDSTIWTKQAFEAKKYAFAADYIRLYALYNFGGIYLDADVLVYKSFDELLSLPYFIGCDQIRAFEAAVIGAEKECSWIKDIFDTYQGKHFIKEDGSLDIMELPVRFHHILTELNYKFIKICLDKTEVLINFNFFFNKFIKVYFSYLNQFKINYLNYGFHFQILRNKQNQPHLVHNLFSFQKIFQINNF